MKKTALALILLCFVGCSDNNDFSTQLNYSIKDSVDQKEQMGNQTEIYFKIAIPQDYNKQQIDTISSIIRHRNLLVPRIDIDYFTEKYYDIKPCYARAFYPDDEQVKKNTKDRDIYNEPRDLFVNGNPIEIIK